MKCRIAKWQVSSALDRGRDLSGWARRHIAVCPSCGSYARFARGLDGLAHRHALDLIAAMKKPVLAIPASAVRAKARLFWLPASAAAGLILAATLFLLPPFPPGTPFFWSDVSQLQKLPGPSGPLQRWIAKADSPLEDEYDSLKKAAAAAARAVQASLDLKIDSPIP